MQQLFALAALILATLAAAAPVPVEHLVLDLDASAGVESDAQGRVLSWTNRVRGFPAQKFVPNDKGRKMPGSGIPSRQKRKATVSFRPSTSASRS